MGRGKGGKEGRGRREGAVLAAEGQFSGSHLGLHRLVVCLFVMFVCLFACRRVGRGEGGKEGRGRREGAVLADEGQFSGFHLGLYRLVVCLFVMFVCLRVGEWGEGREARRVGGGGKALFWQMKDNFQASTWASIGW